MFVVARIRDFFVFSVSLRSLCSTVLNDIIFFMFREAASLTTHFQRREGMG